MKLAVVALGMAILVAGCGNGPSSASYRQRVNAICDRYRAKDRAAERNFENAVARNKRFPVDAYRQEIVALRDELNDIADVEPPPSKRRLVHDWLATGRKLLAQTRREQTVLARDQRRFEKELAHLKLPRHPPTKEEIAHPTAAILDEIYKHSPAWRRYMRDSNRFATTGEATTNHFRAVARRLGVSRCLR